MATKIIHKKSSVAGSAPTAGDLNPGELALNLADRIIYSKTTGGDIVEMGVTNATNLIENCKNVSGGTLTKGTPVYQSGATGNAIEVQAADATNSSKMPAIGVLAEDLVDQAEGSLVLMGFLNGIDTSSFSVGQTLYVSTTTGEFTATAPTGEANFIQNIAKVIKSHPSNGSIVVTGAGRTNATPNLDENKIFIGDVNNKAVTVTHEINNLTDVDTVTVAPAESYVLTWNDTTEVWEPRSVPVASTTNLGSWTLGNAAASGWTITEASGTLIIRYGINTVMSVDSNGEWKIKGDLYNNSGAIGGTTDTEIGTGEWGHHDVGTNYYFQYESTNLMRITSTGDLYLVGDLTLNQTIAGNNSSSFYFNSASGPQIELETNGEVTSTNSIDTNATF